MRRVRPDVAALLRKYAVLAELRELGSRVPTSRLRELAAEYPGALRELDTLPLELIRERATSCKRVLERAEEEQAWMAWMLAYHALMRAALAVKRELGRTREPMPEQVAVLSELASRISGMQCDTSFVTAVAAPPEGRLNLVVLRRIARAFDLEPAALASALFPARPVRAF